MPVTEMPICREILIIEMPTVITPAIAMPTASMPPQRPTSEPTLLRCSPRAIQGAHVSVLTQSKLRPPCHIRQQTWEPASPLLDYQLQTIHLSPRDPPAYESVQHLLRSFIPVRSPPSYAEAMGWISTEVDSKEDHRDLPSAAVYGPIIWSTATEAEIAARPYSLLNVILAGYKDDDDIDGAYLAHWL